MKPASLKKPAGLPLVAEPNPNRYQMLEAPPSSPLRELLLRSSTRLSESLATVPYTPHRASNISVKAFLEPLLLPTASVKDLALTCALLCSSAFDHSGILSWIPSHLSSLATSSFSELSCAYLAELGDGNHDVVVPPEKRLVLELMPEILPLLKERIQESSINKSDESDEVPVGFAILAAFQFRWFITQVDYPHLGKLCGLVIPCALTAVDHWSAVVKGQGMISLAHIGRNVDAAELGGYVDAVLDACCQNTASDDEIWHHVVEASVVLVTLTQRSNPRSPWYIH
ncbi:hypothetical protein V8G54_020352 [Vigna mungo]|uniref:Uncharacterized protein n=1 Tax=Vigna mungo TaxID=3915 RepID=A0AAQ3RWL7_VIGMU